MRLDWASGRHDASYKAQVKAVALGLAFEDVAPMITELMVRAGRSPRSRELDGIAFPDALQLAPQPTRILRSI
jgi:hypothetical protein